MRDRDNVEEIAALLPDYIGFNFYPNSKRYVGDEFDVSVREILRSRTKAVGIFVNETLARIEDKVTRYSLDAIQLHGDESAEFCQLCKGKFSDIEIIKAIAIAEDESFASPLPYEPYIDFLLFDSKSVQRGGSGKTFNWTVLEKLPLGKPFFLSGGIGLNHIDALRGAAYKLKKLAAVDINSRFESAPGIKQRELVSQFIEELIS